MHCTPVEIADLFTILCCHPCWCQFWSCPNDDDVRQAAVCCQSACPPRDSVLTADFHAFAEYSTEDTYCSAKQKCLRLQYNFLYNARYYCGGQATICRQASAQPISDPTPSAALTTEMFAAIWFYSSENSTKHVHNLEFAPDSRNLSK